MSVKFSQTDTAKASAFTQKLLRRLLGTACLADIRVVLTRAMCQLDASPALIFYISQFKTSAQQSMIDVLHVIDKTEAKPRLSNAALDELTASVIAELNALDVSPLSRQLTVAIAVCSAGLDKECLADIEAAGSSTETTPAPAFHIDDCDCGAPPPKDLRKLC